MAIMIANKDPRLEEYWGIDCVFADTGGEHPETYEWIKKLDSYLKKKGMKIHTVAKEEMLFDYYKRKKIIPLRKFRFCTARWKVQVIEKFLKKEYNGEEIITLIGYTIEEMKRKERLTSDRITPLIDLGYTREDCIQEIKKYGFKIIPRKSGCYFCVFQGKKEWKKLYQNYPELFRKALFLEDECVKYNFNDKKALLDIVPAAHKDQKSLCEYGGYCNL